ncbi:rhamnan synthesis F family protein [Lacrimispora celerecrescens]|uniref:rhamnan synthesis F family protein n=1 Tax=Lacrimispora celerecrescens TaxID=29354 RepID=UPI00164A0098|nr:rhamnan synthesis F family protein [Lacrimispora celerecrescens]
MRNVSDIKRDKNLNFILSNKYINNINDTIAQKEMAVFIHMHYEDTVKYYFKYIINIPEPIDIYITVSNKATKAKIFECIKEYRMKNCFLIDKNNRGRDISALLVACRNKILEYQYICFAHDKKEKSDYTKTDTQFWIEGLWENTMGSTEYIYNIKELFVNNKKLGIIFPPNPLSDQISLSMVNTWFKNFDLTRKLAEELGLVCNISEDKPPIALGTVFWCRVAALRKLFIKEWDYEDFPDEPLPHDGTISHAIERILAYVAQDAGYLAGITMTDTYAGKQFEYRNMILAEAFNCLSNNTGISSVSDLFHYDEKRKKMESFFELYSNIYIYGTGFFGIRSFRMMETLGKRPKAFIVSDGERTAVELNEIPILEISEVKLDKDYGIILAVSPKYVEEIKRLLAKKKFDNFTVYIDN